MIRAALVLLFAFPLAAQLSISVLPPAPTTATPVTVRFTDQCANESNSTAAVVRDGSLIRITITQRSSCPSPPLPWRYEVPVGLLPSGQYRVEVYRFERLAAAGSFVVRRTDVELRPFAVPDEPNGLQVSVQRLPPGPPCKEPCTSVRVGGTPVGGFTFIAPRHPPGFADLSYTAQDGSTVVIPNALFYYDSEAPPDPSLFEPVLFPVLFRSAGAGGSDWRTEAGISNPMPWFVQTFNNIQPIVCVTSPCGERLTPRDRVHFEGHGYPHGVALLVPRQEAETLAFTLRVRDVSREAEGFGTEVPVVREAEMFRNTEITLLDVPLDPRHRAKLRVYAFLDPAYANQQNAPEGVDVALLHSPGKAITLTGRPLVRDCARAGNSCAMQPHYAEIDLAHDPAKGNRADVYVHLPEGARGWAFVSVTNNTTQQVTLVTPDGRGGSPCDWPYDGCR